MLPTLILFEWAFLFDNVTYVRAYKKSNTYKYEKQFKRIRISINNVEYMVL